MKNKGGLIILALGVVLIIAALVVKMVILPSMAVFPDDVDTVRKYEGTLHVMLDPNALATMDLANLFLNEVPVTLERHVTTEEVDGNKAIVLEKAAMLAPDGSTIQATEDWYAIDRKTMNAIPDFSGNDKVVPREGLVIGFPIGTEKKDYPGWSDDYQKTTTAEYAEEEVEIKGLNTYVFESSSPAKEIVGPAMLSMFPEAIPKDLFLQLAGGIDMGPMQEVFALLVPNLPDMIPLKYTYEYETRYWVEPATGVLIDYNKHETRQVALSKDFLMGAIPEGVELPEDVANVWSMLPDPLPLLEVFDLEYVAAESSIEDAANDAKDARGQLNLYGTTVPLILIVLGVVLIVVGVVLFLRKGQGAVEA
jgi:hypothetical protein